MTPVPAAVATIDPLLALLVGALGAALIGLFGAWVQSRREHVRWIRQEQFSAYRSFLQIVEKDDHFEIVDHRAYLDELGSARATVELVGPERVSAVALEHFHAALKYGDLFRRFMNEEVDAELATEMKTATKRQFDTRRAFVIAARKQLRM